MLQGLAAADGGRRVKSGTSSDEYPASARSALVSHMGGGLDGNLKRNRQTPRQAPHISYPSSNLQLVKLQFCNFRSRIRPRNPIWNNI